MRFKVYIAGQRRRVTDAIKRELRRRPAIEPVIGHAKAEHGMGRNFLKGAHGDAANAVLAAAGYNFRRLLAWLAMLWRVLIAAIFAATEPRRIATQPDARSLPSNLKAPSSRTTLDRCVVGDDLLFVMSTVDLSASSVGDLNVPGDRPGKARQFPSDRGRDHSG